MALKRDCKNRNRKHNDITNDIGVNASHYFVVDRLRVYAYLFYLPWIERISELADNALDYYNYSGKLYTAAGASRAAAYKHKQNKNDL